MNSKNKYETTHKKFQYDINKKLILNFTKSFSIKTHFKKHF